MNMPEIVRGCTPERFRHLCRQLRHANAEVFHCFSPDDVNRQEYLRIAWEESKQWHHGLMWQTDKWDRDPRELWDIPEAVDLCKTLINEGWLAVLRPFQGTANCIDMHGTGALLLCIACYPQQPTMGDLKDAVEAASKLCSERWGR